MIERRSNSGEGGGEVLEGPRKCGTGMADREGHNLHPFPVFSEGRDEGEYFSVFLSNLMSQPRSLQKPI